MPEEELDHEVLASKGWPVPVAGTELVAALEPVLCPASSGTTYWYCKLNFHLYELLS